MAIALSLGPGFPPKAHDLLKLASTTSVNACHPHSGGGYLVGAAVENSDGSRFSGAFMENASYGLTVCAEIAAVLAASSAGHRDIMKVAIAGGRSAHEPGPPCTPCGACRQVIWEAAKVSGREIEVYCADLSLTNILLTTSGELLPLAWWPGAST